MRKFFPYLYCSAFLFLSLSANAQSGTAHYDGKIIDMHVHIAIRPGEEKAYSPERTNALKDVQALMKRFPIARSVIITMARKGNMRETRLNNDSIITLAKLYPEFIPVCSVHPMDGAEALEEMKRVHDRGVKIIKLHPNSQRFDVAAPEVDAVAKKAGELGMILLFDSYSPTDAGEIGKLILLAAGNPNAGFIFAHMGLVNFPQLLTIEALKKYPWFRNNIWFDISAVAPLLGDSPFREQLMWIIRKIGVDQFMYGSDFPVFDAADAIKGVHAMGFTPEEEKKIFYSNACRLLQIQP